MTEQTEMVDFSLSSPLAVPPPAVAERIQKQPECRLLWAVLENAVDPYMKNATATGRREIPWILGCSVKTFRAYVASTLAC